MSRSNLILFVLSVLCLMQAGCTDYSYEGVAGMKDDDENFGPQKVLMFIGKSNDIARDTRGTGVIDGEVGLNDRSFYVYSFLKGNIDVPYSETSYENSLSCLIDASIDDPESVQGREVFWNAESGLVEWKALDVPVLYYPDGDALGLNYDFFAYYVDDMELEEDDFTRDKNSVKVDIEIDGSQDVMSSVAKPKEDDLRLGLDDYDDEYAGKEYAYRKECSFSWYTAEKNIHPTFVFKHHLVKLDFKFVPGHTPGLSKDVRVEKIEVCSQNKGVFTVAHKNPDYLGIDFTGDPVSLELREKDGTEYVPREISTAATSDVVQSGTIDDLGSLLVAPGTDYYLYLTLTETRDGEPVSSSERNEHRIYLGSTPGPDPEDADREDGGVFVAGGEYLITLTVFGKMDVIVSTEMTDWKDGGDFVVDSDKFD